ncbi:hypothetical protein [Companilactobacillus zhachilii]|uniref:hypothetical protein n=1 Tax=Companilactobacillus zhachilii TaxID=2304606 RepID=UPI0040348EA6
MFTKEQILNAARNTGVSVSPTPKYKEPAFVSTDGSRYPIIKDSLIIDEYEKAISSSISDDIELINSSSTQNMGWTKVDDLDISKDDVMFITTKYDNTILENLLNEEVKNYKEFSKKGSHSNEVLSYCVSM